MKKRLLVLTGGGDCPGLNTVIRAVVRSAYCAGGWEVIGSKRAFNGVLEDPQDLVTLDYHSVSGIHVKGGTILETVNKGDPFAYPIQDASGNWVIVDRSDDLIRRLNDLDIDAVVSIGGDGSQKISQKLFEKGVNIVGVPKTIDNDLFATDLTFGFQTAVEIATEAVDKLVTTAESHNRVMIAEVMGRDAGWICLHTAVAAGAEIALIPEIPYDLDKLVDKIQSRVVNNRGFAIMVVAEGSRPKDGVVVSQKSKEIGYQNVRLGGIGYHLMADLQDRIDIDMRVTVLGHVQRGGIPVAFDRVLATQFGAKAFDLVQSGQFGHMVSYSRFAFTSVPIKEAISYYKFVTDDNYLLQTARNMGMCLGD